MGIGVGEGLVLLLIAALFLRGDEFATVARKAGQWMGQAQRMSRSFMDELQREADRSGLEKSTREIRDTIKAAKSGGSGQGLKSWLDTDEISGPAEETPESSPKPQSGGEGTANAEDSSNSEEDSGKS